jgi:hypothetical protein
MEVYDNKLVYYYNTKTLISFVIRPLPIIFAICYTFIQLISFVQGYKPGSPILPTGFSLINLWIGAISAFFIYDHAQGKFDLSHLSQKPSYIWPILGPILWLLFTMLAWFITLPLYIMYTKRY